MKQKQISIQDLHVKVIDTILDEKLSKKEILQHEYSSERKKLEEMMSSNSFITEFNKSSDIIDAESISTTSNQMYVDLLTCFKGIDELDNTVVRHKKINESTLNNLKVLLLKAEDTLSNLLEENRSNYINRTSFYEGFRNIENFEDNVSYYKERDGSQLSESHKVSFNQTNECIQLPYTTREDIVRNRNGVPFANVKVSMQLGSDLKIDTGYPISNCLSTTNLNYWKEIIRTDEVISVPLDENYYGIKFGAVCEFEITLETASIVNEISLSPYGPFPFELVAIRYFETASDSEEIKEILSPKMIQKDMQSKFVDSPTSIRFSDKLCKRIRVLINQIHYTFDSQSHNVQNNKATKLLDKSNVESYSGLPDDVFKAMYKKRMLINESWALMNNLVKEQKEITLETFLGKEDKNTVQNKYTYVYGVKNLGVNFNDFQQNAVYVSKQIDAGKGIRSVSIETEESHDKINNSEISDIEYYITSDEKGSQSDWMPIVPSNVTSIRSEKVFFDLDTSFAMLRFPIDNVATLILYENGRALLPVFDYSIEIKNGDMCILKLKNGPKLNGYYTAKYTPKSSSKSVLVTANGQEIKKAKERIKSVGVNIFSLSNSPYVDKVNKPKIEVTLTNGVTIYESSGQIENVTNYNNTEQSYINFTNNKLQYYIHKDKLFFNELIEKDAIVNVEYGYYVSKIRLKAIIRKNSHKELWSTPTLSGYKVNFDTL